MSEREFVRIMRDLCERFEASLRTTRVRAHTRVVPSRPARQPLAVGSRVRVAEGAHAGKVGNVVHVIPDRWTPGVFVARVNVNETKSFWVRTDRVETL